MTSNRIHSELYEPLLETTMPMIHQLMGRATFLDLEYTPQGWWVTECDRESRVFARKLKDPARFLPHTRDPKWVSRAAKSRRRAKKIL